MIPTLLVAFSLGWLCAGGSPWISLSVNAIAVPWLFIRLREKQTPEEAEAEALRWINKQQ